MAEVQKTSEDIGAAQGSAPKTGTATVVVASRLTNPFIMELMVKTEISEPVLGGGMRTIQQWQRTSQTWTINGIGHAQDKAPVCEIHNGYALTFGVPKDFAEKWFEQYKSSTMVDKGFLFMVASKTRAIDVAAEKEHPVTGFERIDPKNPPKNLRAIQPLTRD